MSTDTEVEHLVTYRTLEGKKARVVVPAVMRQILQSAGRLVTDHGVVQHLSDAQIIGICNEYRERTRILPRG